MCQMQRCTQCYYCSHDTHRREREPVVDTETNKSEEEQSYGRCCNGELHHLAT